MKMASRTLFFVFFFYNVFLAIAQDYVFPTSSPPGADGPPAMPPAVNSCDGIFLTYTFISREKEYPHVKNATAQAWAFKSVATILNAGTTELKAWKIFIGFQHNEILVSASGAVVMSGDDLPARVGNNGTYLSGYPQADLLTSIDTAGDLSQIEAQIQMTGTVFGVKPPHDPMPKTIKLSNDGFKCPASTTSKSSMYVCCVKDPKFKVNATKTKFLARQNGDLSIVYDVLQAYEGNYLAQVTIDNNNPLGRLDHWNLTWEWMNGEFIYSMRGAYTYKKDATECIYGSAAIYYQGLDFSQVMNCERKPVITDLPPDRKDDDKIGKLPYCCKNGTLLPTTMNETKARAIFQLQVYKLPPNMNRTALTPPQKWKINGVINPDYKCGAPVRVAPTEFPDPSGLNAVTYAMASWQVTCNITRPKNRDSRCCVSFSAFYNESAIPCNTCSCGCQEEETDTCDPDAPALLLPHEALLVPFVDRADKAKSWAKIKHLRPVTRKMPCPDNCGVSINWHINSDYRNGWTARVTLFNWAEVIFEDWFTAVQMAKAYAGYENVYSFNGTKLPNLNNTIFFQGLPGLTYLMGEVNGTNPDKDPRVPGKQQSVVSFSKKNTPGIDIAKGDGFPSRVFFNGEECSLPTEFPTRNGASHHRSHVGILPAILFSVVTFVVMMDHLH